MTAATEKLGNLGEKMTLSEILFGTLLAVAAISCIWISSTLLIHLSSGLF